ncbi:MAG: amidohydrolase family protein [Nitriliruptorales bacterium]|nr:amidohydrolase family protein [Nitriliruptorales bacterium]
MSTMLIRNGRVLDVESGDYLTSSRLRITDGVVVEIGPSLTATGGDTIDAGDRVVMPGLIDAHVHPMLSSLDVGSLRDQPVTLLAQKARIEMEHMLRRGFTTARDACGGDRGLADAVATGLINGPRLFVSGRALSQTGGHGDSRTASDFCAAHSDVAARIADGVAEVRRAAREELKAGADQLKIMASGGVASPSDEIWTLQYTVEEMRAVVEEAAARRTYVLAHAYTAEAITRAVTAGVRSIEHGNLLDADAAALMAEHSVFLVPTLITYQKIHELGGQFGMPAGQRRKVTDVIDAGLGSLKLARDAGVEIGFGSDLLGELQVHQSGEFRVRSRVEEPIETIRSATIVNAQLLGVAGEVGVLRPGAQADLLIVDGDPLSDATELADPDRIDLVLRAGQVRYGR